MIGRIETPRRATTARQTAGAAGCPAAASAFFKLFLAFSQRFSGKDIQRNLPRAGVGIAPKHFTNPTCIGSELLGYPVIAVTVLPQNYSGNRFIEVETLASDFDTVQRHPGQGMFFNCHGETFLMACAAADCIPAVAVSCGICAAVTQAGRLTSNRSSGISSSSLSGDCLKETVGIQRWQTRVRLTRLRNLSLKKLDTFGRGFVGLFARHFLAVPPSLHETCDHGLFPTWGLDRREGHTGGAWPVAINVPPADFLYFLRESVVEHLGGDRSGCRDHHTEGGVVARLMCPSKSSSLLGLGVQRLLRAQISLGVVQ